MGGGAQSLNDGDRYQIECLHNRANLLSHFDGTSSLYDDDDDDDDDEEGEALPRTKSICLTY